MQKFDWRISFCIASKLSAAAALVFAVALASDLEFAFASPITIDDFSQPNPYAYFALGSGMNPSKQMTQLSSGAIGGQRDSSFNVKGAGSPNSAAGVLGFEPDYQQNAFQLGTNGLSPTVATLQYSGVNNLGNPADPLNATGLGDGLGIDLTDGGTNDRFQFQFFSVDALPTAGLDLAVTITSAGNTTSVAKGIVPNSQDPFVFSLPFSSFVGSASLADVDSIQIVFNGTNHTPNIDFEVRGAIATVPEPAGALPLCFAAVWLGIALRKKAAVV